MLVPPDPVIAIGLLTKSNLDRLGDSFVQLWPVDDAVSFEALLAAIGEADRQLRREMPSTD